MAPAKTQLMVLDDDELMHRVWQIACKGQVEVIFFTEIPSFLKSISEQTTLAVVIDRFFGAKDLVTEGFVQDIRKQGYQGPVILSSDLRISPVELENYGFAAQIEKRKVTAKHVHAFLGKLTIS